MYRTLAIALLLLASSVSFSQAGPFPSHLDEAVDPSQIVAWGSSLADYSPTSEVDPSSSDANPLEGLGPANGSTVSLGDLANPSGGGEAPGSITIEFSVTIFDGLGDDFAVFENAGAFFPDPDFMFAELAFVEVSSNGIDFARFPSTSLNVAPGADPGDPSNEIAVPFGAAFAGINTTNVHNLAGVNATGTGTPFDLSDLTSDPLVTGGSVDLSNISFVRLVDIPGDGTFTDSSSNPILDAWPTIGPGGFDLDAVGAINAIPEPASLILVAGLLATLGIARRR